MKLSNKAGRILKWAVLCLIVIAILLPAVDIIQVVNGSLVDYKSRVAYKTEKWEAQDTVKVKHIAREKGKEAIYTVDSSWGGEVRIPENTYLQYIGEENNTVTIQVEELTIYIATKRSGFDETEQRTFWRTSYPWEEKPQEFSHDEIVEAINELEDTAQPWRLWTTSTYTQWEDLDFSFQFDRVAWGIYNKNCLSEGAIKYTANEPTEIYATNPITLIANLLLPIGVLFLVFPWLYQHDGAVQKKTCRVSEIIGWTVSGIGAILNWLGSGSLIVIAPFCMLLVLNIATQFVILQDKRGNK